MRRPDPPESWADLPFFTDGRWPALWNRLSALPDWQPAPERLFRALALTPRASVRVVILGHATRRRVAPPGLPFPSPASPRATACEYLAELATDIGAIRTDGDLTSLGPARRSAANPV